MAKQASKNRMITGLKGAIPLCHLGILENAAFIKLSEGMIFLWGAGLGAARRARRVGFRGIGADKGGGSL